jgi:Fungal Zn(2)-Cys(6) binuclear cluster domain
MTLTRKKATNISCWTCRSKRVKCDGFVPSCRKCVSSNRQCLGYSSTKPLVWTNGIASRGKMMGKTFYDMEQLARDKQVGLVSSLQSAKDRGSLNSAKHPWNIGIAALSPFLGLRVLSNTPELQELSPASRRYIFYCKWDS